MSEAEILRDVLLHLISVAAALAMVFDNEEEY
jgi:hypothetical protein